MRASTTSNSSYFPLSTAFDNNVSPMMFLELMMSPSWDSNNKQAKIGGNTFRRRPRGCIARARMERALYAYVEGLGTNSSENL